MAKVGLKDTLALLAKGYSKKEIDAMAEIDEQTAAQAPAPDDKKETGPVTEKVPDTTPAQDPEPDYKAMYEELLKKNQETEAKVTKLQQDNIHANSAPAAAEAREKEREALTDLVRGFM